MAPSHRDAQCSIRRLRHRFSVARPSGEEREILFEICGEEVSDVEDCVAKRRESLGAVLARARIGRPISPNCLNRRPDVGGPGWHRSQIGWRVCAAQSRKQLQCRRQFWNRAVCAVNVYEARPIKLLLEGQKLGLELGDQQRRTDVSGLVILVGPHRGRNVGNVDVTHVEIRLGDIERNW
jgi:hypothetical protein